MTASPTETSLLSLPDELLEDIVERFLAGYPKHPTALALTCRRFARLVRSRRFREIEYGGDVQSHRELLSQQAFRINPDAPGLVCSLEYQPRYRRNEDLEYIGDAELPYLFFLFPGIRHLRLRGVMSQHVDTFITGPPAVSDGLLRRLEIRRQSDDDQRDAYLRRPGWWNPLRRFTHLESLAIVAGPGEEDGGKKLAVETSQLLPLEHVRILVISAAIYPSTGLPLSTVLPNLEVLTVRVFDHKDELWQFSHLVRTAPPSLVNLRIRCVSPFGTSQPIAESLNALSSRSTLRHLTLSGAAFNADGLLRYLSSSSLCSLTFQHRSPLGDTFLLHLVTGETRMKSLEVLRLDHFGPSSREGVRFSLTYTVSRTVPADLASAVEKLRSACAPQWREDRTLAGLRRVVDEARPNGIRVVGRALESLEWEQVFEEEVVRCLVGIAYKKEDRSLIDEYFGREKADEAIRRHAWRFANDSDEATA